VRKRDHTPKRCHWFGRGFFGAGSAGGSAAAFVVDALAAGFVALVILLDSLFLSVCFVRVILR